MMWLILWSVGIILTVAIAGDEVSDDLGTFIVLIFWPISMVVFMLGAFLMLPFLFGMLLRKGFMYLLSKVIQL